MSFGHLGWAMASLPILLVVSVFLIWSHRAKGAALARAFPSPWLARLTDSVSPARRRARMFLLAAAMFSVALGLAQPRWGTSSIQVERSGIDLVVALDVSRSMLAPDAGPTHRLGAARVALENLLAGLGGDRLGLILFAGEAHLTAPLTRDHTAILRALADLDPGAISEPGSDLAKAILLAREGFQRGAEGPRALLVVSDGEQLRGDAVAAARAASAAGIVVHTAGVGSLAGARIPATSNSTGQAPRYTLNAQGREVLTRMDEAALQRIASAGRGMHVRLTGDASADTAALKRWFDDTAASLPRTSERRDLTEPSERFQWPLTVAFACLVLQAFLGERRSPPHAHPVPRPPMPTRAAAAARLVPILALFSAGAFLLTRLPSQAATVGATPSSPTPPTAPTAPSPAPPLPAPQTSPWDQYNRALADYESGRFETALESWIRLSGVPLPRRLRAPVRFQAGNAAYRLGEPLESSAPEQAAEWWRRSRAFFQSTLALAPSHEGALHNLRRVESRLARLDQSLGRQLVDRSRPLADAPAIELLRAALDPLEEAVGLAPDQEEIRTDRDQARTALTERLLRRATEAEVRGDREAEANQGYADRLAVERYQSALEDLAEAEQAAATTAPPTAIAEAIQRVRGKLARVLTRAGDRERTSARSLSQGDPDAALDAYDRSIEAYQAAQEAVPGHEPARAGEQQAKAEMEALQVRQGREDLERGRRELAAERVAAAESLTSALDHFEAALEINPSGSEARQGAEEARALLPGALNRAGQRQLELGSRAERDSPESALPHVEDAESAFRRTLALEPGNQPAQQGQAEASRRLERLRGQVRKQAEEQAQRLAQLRGGQQPGLGELLGEVEERRRPRDTDRRRQRSKNQARPRTTYPDW